MFREEGLTPAVSIWNLLALNALPPDIKKVVNARAEEQHSFEEEYRTSKLNEFRDILGPNTARQREINRARVFAFRRILREHNLYLIGPGRTPVPVTFEILELNHLADGDVSFLLLDLMMCSVRVSHHLRAIENIMALAAYDQECKTSHVSLSKITRVTELKPVFEVLLPHEGMLLAVDTLNLPTQSNLREAHGIDESGDIDKQIIVGRPRKQEFAARAYNKRFPNGHGAYTWLQVVKILEAEEGIKVSVQTLKNGIEAPESN